jgi:hypothetical protein
VTVRDNADAGGTRTRARGKRHFNLANFADDAPTMRKRLATLLGFAEAGVDVRWIRMVGNGSTAAVEIGLSNELVIFTERFGDLWTPAGLSKFVTQNTGVRVVGVKKDEAEEANALIRRLARLEHATTTADLGRDHAGDFLRDAPVGEFALNDQASRYDAFVELDELNPVKALEDADLFGPTSIAAASKVLRDAPTGDRYVHCGHLFADVRRRGQVGHPAELARRMELAGWTRRGKSGRIKATPPHGLGRPVVIPLWRISADWEPDS